VSRVVRASALRRLKDTYRDKGVLLHPLERHVMKSIESRPDDRAQDWMHPSDMSSPDWCGRHDYFRIINTPVEHTSKANPSFRMSNVFAEGHAIHGKYQTWLWEMGVLWGDWQCKECGHRFGALSPKQCQFCLSERIIYKELPMRHNLYRIQGHADAAVHDLDGWSGLVEIKSVGINSLRFESPRLYNLYQDGMSVEEIWFRMNRPFASHLRQGMLYLWMTWPRYEQIVFLYESKFHQQTKEFVVDYNKRLIEPVLEDAREVSHALKSGIPPQRPYWATEADGKVCSSCEYRHTCWQLEATHVQSRPPTPTVIVKRGSSVKRRRALRPA
jgi:hypothetical protein